MKRANRELFFKDVRLPFVEARYAEHSRRLFKPHMHRTFSVGAVRHGELQYQINEKEFSLHSGSLALINPETIHSCNPKSHHARSYYMLYLDVAWCLQIQQTLRQVDTFLPVGASKLDDSIIYGEYLVTMDLLLSSKPGLPVKEQALAQLIGNIFAATCAPEQNRQPANIKQINQLKQLLSRDLDQEITLAAVAERLASNPYTLLRRFKRETGITPHAYRLNCRIEQAKRYLQQGMEIADTALLCGFCDQSHFHRTFKAMTTVTPQEYQQGVNTLTDTSPCSASYRR